jgi:hypothetical protein
MEHRLQVVEMPPRSPRSIKKELINITDQLQIDTGMLETRRQAEVVEVK